MIRRRSKIYFLPSRRIWIKWTTKARRTRRKKKEEEGRR